MRITIELPDKDAQDAVERLGLGLHLDSLTQLAKAKEASQAATGIEAEGQARIAVFWAMQLAAAMVGPETLKTAYGEDPPEDGPRENILSALWWRLIDLDGFYIGQGSLSSSSSIRAAADELAAIINGDAPRLFAPLREGTRAPLNAYRLARHQLRALEWGLFLKRYYGPGKGAAKKAHDAVAEAYGQPDWDTVRKWRDPVIERLGELAKRVLASAEHSPPAYFRHFKSESDIAQALAKDGRDFMQERRASLKVLPGGGK